MAGAGQPVNPIPAMTVYLPLERPVVVISPYLLAQYPVNLTVATKMVTWREQNFIVKDVNGTIIFRIKRKGLSLQDRGKLVDAAGTVLISMEQKLMTAHRRWMAYRGDSKDSKDLLFTVRKSSSQLDVFLAGNEKEEVPDFKIKGRFSACSCVIYLGNTNKIIAQMHRGHSMANFLLDTDDFSVTIYPNVDYAFIISLVGILDEIYQKMEMKKMRVS